MDIVEEIKATFKKGSNLTKLIYINLGVFLLAILVRIVVFLFKLDESFFSVVNLLAIPSDLSSLLIKPWTFFSYMFLHERFWHILFNLLWLYWFGVIFLRFLHEKKLLSIYLVGGLVGAVFYVLAFNIFPVFSESVEYSVALGASASVMAVVVATAVYAPDYQVMIPFLGPVKIKYIAIIFVVLDLIQLPIENSGGHIAHLGGAFWGFLYIRNLRNGKDIAARFDRLMDTVFSWFRSGKRLKVSYKRPMTDMEYNQKKNVDQARIDQILEKISQSGYDSLSKEEKDILFNYSNKK
jgi:membrane associated rhomboid family serine protease